MPVVECSLIVTTLNEADNMGGLISDVAHQSALPRELIIVDGGSADGTVEIIERMKSLLAGKGTSVVVMIAGGVGIAQGRNLAIARAATPIICVTDAGCRLDGDWMRRIVEPIVNGRADFVGGYFRPIVRNRFQSILASLTIAPCPPRDFLPSSRSVAFTKERYERAGRYPEWLPWGEDTLFNERMLASGARYCTVEDAIVHWEVRRNLRAAVRQFYRYSWGDGYRRRISVSHLCNVFALMTSVLLGLFASRLWFGLFPVYILLIIGRVRSHFSAVDLPMAFGIAACLRVARVLGYLTGLGRSFSTRAARHRGE